jgi:hypothetical protein
MKKYAFLYSAVLLLVGMPVAMRSVSAEEVPASKCVTAATQATNAAAIAQMEKDIAPHAKEEKAAKVIEQYRQNIQTAWEAMEQPYCGYGAYGTASAIKSLSKSINRARSTFLKNIKNPSTASVSLMVPAQVQMPQAPNTGTGKGIEKTTVVKEATVSTGAVVIQKGLHRGMKSSAVKALQEKLASYYHLSSEEYVTGYFGPKTQQLVIKFQIEKKLISGSTSSAAGLVGPKTAAALNGI